MGFKVGSSPHGRARGWETIVAKPSLLQIAIKGVSSLHEVTPHKLHQNEFTTENTEGTERREFFRVLRGEIQAFARYLTTIPTSSSTRASSLSQAGCSSTAPWTQA